MKRVCLMTTWFDTHLGTVAARWQRLSPFLTLFILSFAIRIWRVNDWLLPNVDEIVLNITLGHRFLEGCSASSTYWPAHLILRAFFFLDTFYQYRFISVLFGSATIVMVYALALRLAKPPVAWGFCALLSFQWYLLYMSRIIEIASFIPLFTVVCLWAVIRWRETRRPVFVWLFFGLGGIAANTWTPPMFYFLAAGAAFFLWEAVCKRLAWKWLGVAHLILFVMLIPWFHVLWTTGRLREDILLRYQMTGAAATRILPANIASPSAAIQTWTNLVTFFHEQLPWKWLATFAVAVLITPFAMFPWIRSKLIAESASVGLPRDSACNSRCQHNLAKAHVLSILLFLAAIQLLLLIVSPVPLYIEGHAFPLLLCVLLLLFGMATAQATPISARCVAGGLLLFSLLSSFGFTPYYMESQQTRLRDWLRHNVVESGISRVCVSDGVYLKLTKIPSIAELGITYEVFTNAPEDPFWKNHSPSDFPVIISTYECNMDAYVRSKGFALHHQFTMNNLYEAHLRHGIDAWRVANTGTDQEKLKNGVEP